MTPRNDDTTTSLATEFTALVEAGRQALANGELEAACKAFTAATEEYPEEAVGHNNLGAFWMGLGEFARAEAAFRQAATLLQDNANCLFNLAMACFRQEHFEDAVEAFAAAAAAAPADAETLNNLGTCRFQCGQVDQARKDIEAAIQLQPNYPAAILNLSDLEYSVGRIDKAVAICQAYLDHHHDGAVAHQLLTIIDSLQANTKAPVDTPDIIAESTVDQAVAAASAAD